MPSRCGSTPKEVIAGRPATDVRHLLRKAQSNLNLSVVQRTLRIASEDEATRLLAEFERQGFIERESSPFEAEDGPRWRPTVKGNALGKASAAPPIHRATAKHQLEGFIANKTSSRQPS